MTSHLLAVKITSRRVGAALFLGCELQYVEERQLSPEDLPQARDSLADFVGSLIEHFRVDSCVSESRAMESRVRALTDTMIECLRAKAIPHWPIPVERLLEAFGEDPLTSVHQLRATVEEFWPHLIKAEQEKTCLDAAALGLYFQTERLLSGNSPVPS